MEGKQGKNGQEGMNRGHNQRKGFARLEDV